MQIKKYVSRFCVLLFLIIEYANVNALSLTSCDNPLENEVCNLTCTTTDHAQNVAFSKEPDILSIIAQCVSDIGCFGVSQYNISQPNSMSTILSFIHSRNNAITWRCSYGVTFTSVSVPWATYPQTVSTTLTSSTTVDTNIDGNVTLECLYSEQAPTVTLQYEDANGNNDAKSAETFHCDATDIPCTDVNFTTYWCPVVVKEETGIDHSDTYSIKLKIKVSHVKTEDVHTIVTGITFKRTPDPPTNVSTSCDILSMTVSWRSEFNGGDLQTFNVLWWTERENEAAYSDLVLDPGLHEYTDATIPVTADTRYITTVQATNTHGSVTSGEHVSCRTKQILASSRQDSNVLFAAGISGLVIGLLSIIFSVSFVVFCRFRQKKKDQMRSNNYTEFNTCTRCNPVVKDTYDSLETTNIGKHEVNENQTDIIIATYEEIMPS